MLITHIIQSLFFPKSRYLTHGLIPEVTEVAAESSENIMVAAVSKLVTGGNRQKSY
jgi:hypothetical protein